jgi:hypothetical protein
MHENVRPMLRLALFGTYTIVAIGIGELKTLLRLARDPMPKEMRTQRGSPVHRRGRRR